ncbi:MAG: T9SS type A sorting domain-containing protein, partial [Saprospiraceae bacterium]
GRDWKVINWIEGKGTTDKENIYTKLDREPFKGDNYYRLKQIDFDGAFEYSKIINIPNESSAIEIKVLPNPSPGDVNVTVFNPGKNRMQVTLFDSVGHSIFDSGLLEGSDVWKKQFNLPQKEVYFLQVKIGEEIFTEKILIIDRA